MKRDGRAVSALIVDIDNSKAVNDAYGYSVGEEVLKHVAARMRAQLRAYDDVGRYGGEEFLVVLPACDETGARAAAERLRADVCATVANTSAGGVSVSIGVASA